MSDTLEHDLLTEIEQIRAIDTHAHLEPETDHVTKPLDPLSLLRNYTAGDLVAAGCPQDRVDCITDAGQGSLAKRWELLAPYWPKIRNGSYARAWEQALTHLLDCPAISLAGLEVAHGRMGELVKAGWYREVLRRRCNLETSLLDRDFQGAGHTLREIDRELFRPVIRTHDLIQVSTQGQLRKLEERHGVSLHTLEALADTLRSYVARGKQEGAAALKVALAYSRTLLFEKPTRHEAEACFNRIFAGRGEGLAWPDNKPLQDYLLHCSLQAALDHDMTVIFHTGLQAGGANLLADTNPTLLNNLFMEYRSLRFDLFHAGYPYVRECGVMAKYFPNVWADLAWVHIISAEGTRQFLLDWLDLVPANKILGFGGDTGDVELVYGHLWIARRNLAAVLAERVHRGYDTLEQAVAIAALLLREAPQECFHLES
jgi:uncharacterized protein